jgi:hypothetical protein
VHDVVVRRTGRALQPSMCYSRECESSIKTIHDDEPCKKKSKW